MIYMQEIPAHVAGNRKWILGSPSEWSTSACIPRVVERSSVTTMMMELCLTIMVDTVHGVYEVWRVHHLHMYSGLGHPMYVHSCLVPPGTAIDPLAHH